MKTRNYIMENLHYYDEYGFFDLNLGRFGVMEFKFEVEFATDGRDIEDANCYITEYTLVKDDEIIKHGQLNNRNSKMICELIENLAYESPFSFGYKETDEEDDRLYWQELAYEERRISNM